MTPVQDPPIDFRTSRVAALVLAVDPRRHARIDRRVLTESQGSASLPILGIPQATGIVNSFASWPPTDWLAACHCDENEPITHDSPCRRSGPRPLRADPWCTTFPKMRRGRRFPTASMTWDATKPGSVSDVTMTPRRSRWLCCAGGGRRWARPASHEGHQRRSHGWCGKPPCPVMVRASGEQSSEVTRPSAIKVEIPDSIKFPRTRNRPVSLSTHRVPVTGSKHCRRIRSDAQPHRQRRSRPCSESPA